MDRSDDVNLRVVLGSFGWRAELLVSWLAICGVGTIAALTSLRLAIAPTMPYEDFTWSIAALMALASTLIPTALLRDRVEVMSLTAARSIRPLKVAGFGAASCLALWPALLWLLGAPQNLVVALCAQNCLVLGLAAIVACIDSRLVVAPTVVITAVTVLPRFLPAAVHPLLPSLHPQGVELVELLIWACAGLAWVVTPPGRLSIRLR